MSILDVHQQLFPHLVTIIDQLRIFNQERYIIFISSLWKQLSDTLLIYIKDPQLQQETHLKDLYEGFVKRFYAKIDGMKLVRFLIKAADQYGDYQLRIDFLSEFIKQLEPSAALVLQIKSAYYLLLQGKIEEVDGQLKKFKQQCDRLQEIDPLIYSVLYFVALNFYRVKGNHEEFYLNGLQYLAYTPDNEMPEAEKLSFEMALAILISPNIYNFSELLQQPLIINLKQQSLFLYEFLEIFNRGDVRAFNQHIQQHNQQLQQIELLWSNRQLLEEKIRIMAFLELAFQLPNNARVATFEDLVRVTELEISSVERLVMRTISKGLIKGRINQVKKIVDISFVVPRVLTLDKVDIMLRKFNHWDKSVQQFLKDTTI